MGQYRKAIAILEGIKERLNPEADTKLKATALKSLGDAWAATGNVQPAQDVLQQSLAIARQLSESTLTASVLLSLGKLSQFQGDLEEASDFYQQAASATSESDLNIQATLNWLNVLIRQEDWSQALSLIPELESQIAELPLSGKAVNARINFANSLMTIARTNNRERLGLPSNVSQNIAESLAIAIQQAEKLGNIRTQAFALGTLAKLYEENQQWTEAETLTEQALILAQGIHAADLVYQWQWQLGRILNSSGERTGAIAAYSEAVKTLDSLRGDLVSVSSDLQFSFKERVEPVYRELVDILLTPGAKIEQSHLSQARDTIESLQLAELDNFFRDACLDSTPVQIDRIDPTAATIYPIILPDRLEVIAKLPNQPFVHFTIFESKETIEQTVQELRNEITHPLKRRGNAYQQSVLPIAEQLYDWMIRPLEQALTLTNVETLVFVLDGAMRNVPISVLYDGNQYTIERYAIALTPGLQMLDPTPLTSQPFKTLASGLSQARQNYPALPSVELELQQIEQLVPTEILLNEEFTEMNFKNTVNQAATRDRSTSFPVVHIASHGEFASTAENTFILTWDDRINAKELNSFLQAELTGTNPIELLVLSACRSAVGDNRAALGLAGIAVRAGARSTMGSLWYVSDEATGQLMIRFYQELADAFFQSDRKISKAEALRQAQVSLLRDDTFFHPYFWSAFVLVGNWF